MWLNRGGLSEIVFFPHLLFNDSTAADAVPMLCFLISPSALSLWNAYLRRAIGCDIGIRFLLHAGGSSQLRLLPGWKV